jgi:hypothetical protein
MPARSKHSTLLQTVIDSNLERFNDIGPWSHFRATPSLKQPLRGSRRLRLPKFVNTSMEIWEIQKQLKRGEMVQVGFL